VTSNLVSDERLSKLIAYAGACSKEWIGVEVVLALTELQERRRAAETGAKRGYVGEAPLSYVVLDEIRARCAQHRVSVKEGWTIDNQYTLDRDYLLGLIPPEWTDRPDCPHKTDARKDAPADPDCTWCQSAVKTSAPPEDPHDGLIVELNP
jgi:hypothetical protein